MTTVNVKGAFDAAKANYQRASCEMARAVFRKKNLEKQLVTLQAEVPQVESEAEKLRAAHEQLLTAVAGGEAPETALDDMEAATVTIEVKLKRKTALLETTKRELDALRVPIGDLRCELARLGQKYCLMQLKEREKDIDKLQNQLLDLFGGWGVNESDLSWPEFLKIVFPQPDKPTLDQARDGFVKTVVQPIEKAALVAMDHAA